MFRGGEGSVLSLRLLGINCITLRDIHTVFWQSENQGVSKSKIECMSGRWIVQR